MSTPAAPTPIPTPTGDPVIRFEQARKEYPDGTVAVSELDLEVFPRELLVLVGPSGCGKSTTLRMANRLVDLTSGRVLVEGEDIALSDPVALRRRIGYVIQHVGLFPHRTVGQNVATVPALLGWDRNRTKTRTGELLELVGLEPDVYARRYPHQLSGGERQRVGVARALAADPPVLLMDEPFGAVDPEGRRRLQQEFWRIQRELGTTVMLVTHDIDEAVRLGDRIAVFSQGGRVEQVTGAVDLPPPPATGVVGRFR
ncbi:MAG: ATP-binding cassette domain-containing protein, partial [Cellulomonas sp.]|nr:ATP-binding cassette domain-containing protein [Cellulomonas sp.]